MDFYGFDYGYFCMDVKQNHEMLLLANTIHFTFSAGAFVTVTPETWMASEVCSPYSRLYFVLSGEGHLEYEQQNVILKPGRLYLIPAGLTFSFGCHAPMEKIYFHVNLFRPDGYDVFFGCHHILETPVDLHEMISLRDLFIHEHDFSSAVAVKQMVFRHLADFLLLVAPGSQPLCQYSPPVRDTLDYIQQNLSLQITVCFLAQRLFLAESTLAKLFKKEVGKTIGAYIDDLIFFRALQMMVGTGETIGKISDALGFCDQFYFSRRFKQRFGLTPQQYRKRQKATFGM
ncbi:MAG TPA: hypothetical protein DCY74_09300 [Clostridiales bacterium]|nr:hypothetical protein [Clostridiales bacterium]